MFSKLIKSFRKNILRHELELPDRYPRYRFGRGSYGGLRVKSWGEGATLRVGAYCSFAVKVKVFLGGGHRVDWVTTYPFTEFHDKAKGIKGHPATKGDVVIGNDVWVGTEAVIMSGVNIGDGAVVGARAVVTKDIPPYSIAVGNPARVVKQRFSQPVIDRLLEMQWWNWEESRIEKAFPYLLNEDIEAFIAAVDKGDI